MTPLAASVLRSVVHFDLWSYPITSTELARWLHGPGTLGDVCRALADDNDLQDRLAERDGFWFLKGRPELVAERLRRNRIAERKFRRARRAAALIFRIPGVRMVALSNTLALAASREDGDIDLLVVASPGTLWTVRALAVGALDALGWRPGECARDAICLSFFISTDALNLASLRISSDDVHFAYWAATIRPLRVRGDIYQKFWDANGWVRDVLPNAWPRDVIARSPDVRRGDEAIQKIETGLLRGVYPAPRRGARNDESRIESLLHRLQLRRFPPAIREVMNKDTRVVVNNDVLKFHTNDRRAEYRERWIKKCEELGVVTLRQAQGDKNLSW